MGDVALAVVARWEEPLSAGEVGGADQEADPLHRVPDRSGEFEDRAGQIERTAPFCRVQHRRLVVGLALCGVENA
jgi:hypothetical protein